MFVIVFFTRSCLDTDIKRTTGCPKKKNFLAIFGVSMTIPRGVCHIFLLVLKWRGVNDVSVPKLKFHWHTKYVWDIFLGHFFGTPCTTTCVSRILLKGVLKILFSVFYEVVPNFLRFSPIFIQYFSDFYNQNIKRGGSSTLRYIPFYQNTSYDFSK